MDGELKREFREFWEDFFESRHWPGTALAKVLAVKPDVVSHWRYANNMISPTNVSKLLESEEVNLSPDETAQLIRLVLRRLGFSEASLPYVADALSDASLVNPNISP